MDLILNKYISKLNKQKGGLADYYLYGSETPMMNKNECDRKIKDLEKSSTGNSVLASENKRLVEELAVCNK